MGGPNPQLKTQRLAANDLFSTYPNGQGGLEGALAAIFGFATNVDITASAMSFDNSGRITTPQIQWNVASPKPPTGIGMALTDSSANKQGVVQHDGNLLFQVLGVANPNIFIGLGATKNVFQIDMTTGNLTASTTQDTVNKPLIPQLTGSNTDYYGALGAFTKPGSISFYGCGLTATAVTMDGGGTGFLPLSLTGGTFAGFDLGGHFDGVNKITSGTIGKYFLIGSVAAYSASNNGLNAEVQIQDDGSNLLSTVRVDSIRSNQYLNFATVWNATATTSWIKILCTNNMGSGSFVTFGSDNGFLGSNTFRGSVFMFRIE